MVKELIELKEYADHEWHCLTGITEDDNLFIEFPDTNRTGIVVELMPKLNNYVFFYFSNFVNGGRMQDKAKYQGLRVHSAHTIQGLKDALKLVEMQIEQALRDSDNECRKAMQKGKMEPLDMALFGHKDFVLPKLRTPKHYTIDGIKINK